MDTLVFVDTQYDFISPNGRLYIKDAEKILKNVLALTTLYEMNLITTIVITLIQSIGVSIGLNSFSGNAVERLSIISLGIMPYITASIIMELLAATFPALGKIHLS